MRILTLTAILWLSVCTAGLFANDSWWGDVYEQKAVSLESIMKAPHAFRGIDVTFVVQFQSLGSIENPYYTRFEKEQYVNFAVWGDDAQLWEKSAYESTFPYLFIDRFMKESKEILKARTYDRFIVTGRVTSVFRGKPWIEVVGLKAIEGRMTEPSLIRLVKAYKLKKHRRFDAAAAEFQLAMNKDMTEPMQKHIFHEEGRCLAAVDRFEAALVPLGKAFALAPKDDSLKKMIAHCQEKFTLVKKTREAASQAAKKKAEAKPAPKKPAPKLIGPKRN
ncbi:MAG: hypothetical protein V3W41_07245 [Planctomycetota bacterium]